MKKQLLYLFLILFSTPAIAQDDSSSAPYKPGIFSKWQMTGLDFYYSGTTFNTGINKEDYLYLDNKYSENSGSPNERSTFNPDLLMTMRTFYPRHNFHADLVFTRYIPSRYLQSHELRLGVSYGYVSSNIAEQKYLFSGDSIWTNGDTIFRKRLGYSHAERAASINLTYLLNFRITSFVAVYAGAKLTYTPFQQLRILYDYSRSTSLFDPMSPTALSAHSEFGTNRLGPKNSWSAALIAGAKFNLDCRWNVFAEYTWTYREMLFKGRSMQNTGSGFQAGFRLKFGRIAEEDDEKAEEDNKIFW